jgi:hypothetical protein
MLTSDRIKPELLYPRWLPHWMAGCKLLLYCTAYRTHNSLGGANGCHKGAYGRGVGRVDEIGEYMDERETQMDEKGARTGGAPPPWGGARREGGRALDPQGA